MKYFIPDWDDKVDPQYDFIRDEHSEDHKKGGDVYVWDIFGFNNVPIDGILVSRMNLVNKSTKGNEKCRQILREGIHQYYRFPGEILGDCGAWGYVYKKEPPFKTSETLEFYLKAGFNYGTSIDHLIVKSIRTPDGERQELTIEEKKERWRITIENAREMFELWHSNDDYLRAIRIIGIAQGWDVTSYRTAVRELLKTGYDYIGIGGMARRPSKILTEILRGVAHEIKKFEKQKKKRVDIHVFGVSRPNLIPPFSRLGVTSFDSATFLRWAWVGAKNNYLTLSGGGYAAIRVRTLPEDHPQKPLEQGVLQTLRLYDKGKTDIEDTLTPLKRFEKETGGRMPIQAYRKTLKDKPWKRCDCPICSKLGIEVIIFRGNNRNRRRGFHNTHVFYRKFRMLSPRIFVFTTCTAKKDKNLGQLPAYRRYMASPIFRTFWNNVYDLPVEIGVFSAKFGLINWCTWVPYYDYKLQESDIPTFVKELKIKLKKFDKIFFIGLGLYKKVVEEVKTQTNYDLDIYPKIELTERNKLDIIEYSKQMTPFREAIVKNIPEECRPESLDLVSKFTHKSLEGYLFT